MSDSEMIRRAAKAVAIASDAETAARASIGQEPYIQDEHLAVARAVMEAIRTPTNDMVRAGDAWRAHCSDTDSLFEEMMSVARPLLGYRQPVRRNDERGDPRPKLLKS